MVIWTAVCRFIITVLGIFGLPMMVWTIITTVLAFFKQKQMPDTADKLNSFAVLICARNEETVIGNLLDSISKQDYAGGVQMFVVADNCDDNTADAARKKGAVVFERFDKKHIGKGFALKYGIDCIKEHAKEQGEQIDAICVFDADNLVQASFLTEMNNALCSGAKVACGYRDTKNIHDSWVTEVYSLYWLMLMRFYCKPRYTLGISPMVTGTGFAFLLEALDGAGWRTRTVTEDGEFSIQQILKGNKIAIAERAVFYDEQPKGYRASAMQRARWMTGGLQCLKAYGGKILSAALNGEPKALDMLWYELMIVQTGLALPLNICVTALLFLQPETRQAAPWISAVLGGASYLFGCVMAYIILKLEKRDIKSMRRAILLYPAFLVTMSFIAFGCMFKPSLDWAPIPHENSKTIDDIEGEPS